jgi:hypothetical protein
MPPLSEKKERLNMICAAPKSQRQIPKSTPRLAKPAGTPKVILRNRATSLITFSRNAALIVTVLCSGCFSTSFRKEAPTADLKAAAISCPPGTSYVSAKMTTLSPPPDTSQIQLATSSGQPYFVDAGVDFNVALEACHDENQETFTLERIQYRQTGNYQNFYTSGQIERQDGLRKAILEQDFSELHITAAGQVFGVDRWLQIQGHSVDNLWVATAGQFKQDGSNLVLATEEVVFVGGIDLGHPFPDAARCEDFTDPVAKRLVIEHISFDFEYCRLVGTSGTTNYKIISIAVQDSHPSLSDADRTRKVFGTQEEIHAVADVRIAHHNEGDTFKLTLENVKYEIISFHITGGGQSTLEAQYPNGPFAKVLCGHYLLATCD